MNKDDPASLLVIGFNDLLGSVLKTLNDASEPGTEPIMVVLGGGEISLSGVASLENLPPEVIGLIMAASIAFEKHAPRQNMVQGMLEPTPKDITASLEELSRVLSLVRPIRAKRIPFDGTFSQNPRALTKKASSRVKNFQQRLPPRMKTPRGS